MSNIAIKGATTGTGTFTIESPATNTDRTLTLPDEAGTVLTGASDLPAANLTGDVASARITNALNASGSAPIYACRAWVNFNGTGTVAIRASGNVSSITDQGTGRYRVSLTTAMPDTNYVTVGSTLNSTTPGVNGIAWVGGSDDSGATVGSYTTTSLQIGTYYYPTVGFDPAYVQIAIFR